MFVIQHTRTDRTLVMAASMKLEYLLNDNLPNIDHARDRLLARVFHYRNDSLASQSTTDEDYALLYAYGKLAMELCIFHRSLTDKNIIALVTGQLSTEIMAIMGEIGKLFGVLNEEVVKL